jgi:hypothetical protein
MWISRFLRKKAYGYDIGGGEGNTNYDSTEIANRENQTNINDTGASNERRETSDKEISPNVGGDPEAENEFPEAFEKKHQTVHFPPR